LMDEIHRFVGPEDECHEQKLLVRPVHRKDVGIPICKATRA
jgi:hypothetical protein